MIKEILQDNNNKSLSREKINNKKFNSILNGFDILKKLKTIKKGGKNYTFRKNKNLKLLFNKNDNIYIKKVTNLKTNYLKKANKYIRNKILYRNNNVAPLEKGISYTQREVLNNNYIINEEVKIENDNDKDLYSTERLNYIDKKLTNDLEKEFEIRNLNKKLQQLRKNNSEMKSNLENIKQKNNLLMNESSKNKNNKNNILCSLNNIYNIFFKNRINGEKKIFDLKNCLIDLMDLNYNYENSVLINIFIQNLEQILHLINMNYDKDNIYSNIKNIIKIKNKALSGINKLKELISENEEYSELCNILYHNFGTEDLDIIYNSLIKIESNNEKDIKKIIKMRSILFGNDSSSSKRSIKNMSEDKLRKDKNQHINLNYSDLQKFYIANNDLNNDIERGKSMNGKNYGYLTERIRIDNNRNIILNLKNQNINKRKNIIENNKLEIDKVNQFLYPHKMDNILFRSHYNKDLSSFNKYKNNRIEKNESYKNRTQRINLNNTSININKINQTQNHIYSINYENENDININKQKVARYNENSYYNIKYNNLYPRVSSLKKKNYDQPIYYK